MKHTAFSFYSEQDIASIASRNIQKQALYKQAPSCQALSYVLPFLGFLGTVYSLVGLVPGLALTVRRLRDGGNGWGWIFICLVPLVGRIILIVKLCKASVPCEA